MIVTSKNVSISAHFMHIYRGVLVLHVGVGISRPYETATAAGRFQTLST